MSQLTIPAQPAGISFGILGNVPGGWMAEQKELTVLLKDGYSFFKANREMFTNRFSDPDKSTTILINHPETPFLSAITDKDFNKTEESQHNDFVQTVLLLQDIAATVRQAGTEPKARLLGYNDVPTENIFLGDHEAIKKFYPTQSYRGPLEGVIIDADQSTEASELFNRAAVTCAGLADGRQVVTSSKEDKELPAARPLWDYEVPTQYRKDDLRL